MQWKEGKLVKLVVKSNLGGNLRLRVPNGMKLSVGSLKKVTGKNPNPFYQTEETPAPVVSSKANIAPLALKETVVYDLPTQSGKTYILVTQ